MPKTDTPRDLTVDQAREVLGVESRQGVQYLIDTGKLPGARKLDPDKATSPWLIPVAAVEALVEQRRKAGAGPVKPKK